MSEGAEMGGRGIGGLHAIRSRVDGSVATGVIQEFLLGAQQKALDKTRNVERNFFSNPPPRKRISHFPRESGRAAWCGC